MPHTDAALRNKVALVTGAGRGIGKATAKLFTNEGAVVVIAEFDEVSGQSTANELGAHFIKTDVSKEESVNALFNFVLSLAISAIFQASCFFLGRLILDG